MATFEQIKIQVKLLPEFVGRGDIGDWLLSAAVNDAQRRLQQDIETRFEQASTSVTTTAGTRNYTLPSDYKAMQEVFYRRSGATERSALTRLDKERFDARHPDTAATGTPEHWTIWKGELLLGPTPDTSGDTIIMDYHAFAADLSNGSPGNSNAFTEQFADALRWGAAIMLAPYVGVPMDRLNVFTALYRAARDRAQRQARAEEVSGQAVVARTPGN